jgi:transcriptional regulator GlxA family with amidase domain
MSAMDRRRVAVLALPGVLPLDLGIAVQTFGSDPHYRAAVCCDPSDQPIRSGGFTLTPHCGLEALEEAATVVVPGYLVPDAPVSASVLESLRTAHARGARLVSICTGAFAPRRRRAA